MDGTVTQMRLKARAYYLYAAIGVHITLTLSLMESYLSLKLYKGTSHGSSSEYSYGYEPLHKARHVLIVRKI